MEEETSIVLGAISQGFLVSSDCASLNYPLLGTLILQIAPDLADLADLADQALMSGFQHECFLFVSWKVGRS